MKTYTLDELSKKYKDSGSIIGKNIIANLLQERQWQLFDDDETDKRFFFKKDGTLLVIEDGELCGIGKWTHFENNGTLYLVDNEITFHSLIPVYGDENILVLKNKHSDLFSFLINAQMKEYSKLFSIPDIIKYLKQNDSNHPHSH